MQASSRTVSVIAKIDNLEELHLSQIKHVSMYSITGILNQSIHLKVLNLSWTFGINDNILSIIEAKMKQLEVLLIISCHDVSEEAVRRLTVSLFSLKELHMDYCRQITPTFVEELLQKGIKATH